MRWLHAQGETGLHPLSLRFKDLHAYHGGISRIDAEQLNCTDDGERVWFGRAVLHANARLEEMG